MDDEPYKALERFLVENPDLKRLEQLSGSFNLFEAIGAVRREERHSDFLSFLLEPRAAHGLGDAVLREFVDSILKATSGKNTPVTRIDAALMDLEGARVEREWSGIDILVISEENKFVLLVENKIDSAEHSDQLSRYLDATNGRFPQSRVLPVLLTPNRVEPTHELYLPADYDLVHSMLANLLTERRSSLPPDVEVAIRHYSETLERHVMKESEIAKLAKKIYEKHRKALDIIYEYKPDQLEGIAAYLNQKGKVRVIRKAPKVLDFCPIEWDSEPRLKQGGDGSWNNSKELVRFQIKIGKNGGMTAHLILGPGPTDLRQEIWDKTPDYFKGRRKRLSDEWTQLWKATVYTAKVGDDDYDELFSRFQEWWDEFSKDNSKDNAKDNLVNLGDAVLKAAKSNPKPPSLSP